MQVRANICRQGNATLPLLVMSGTHKKRFQSMGSLCLSCRSAIQKWDDVIACTNLYMFYSVSNVHIVCLCVCCVCACVRVLCVCVRVREDLDTPQEWEWEEDHDEEEGEEGQNVETRTKIFFYFFFCCLRREKNTTKYLLTQPAAVHQA